MLCEFVTGNRDEIIRRCRTKVTARSMPPATRAEVEFGVPRFLDELVEALRPHHVPSAEIGTSATRHGRDLQSQGFTVSQVVHDYGDVCQSITELALERRVPIGVEDFRTLNRCLDDAIASAVTEFGRVGTQSARDKAAHDDERIGMLVHELRNLVNTANLAFTVLESGNVGVGGSTGRVLKRSLAALCDLIDRSVADVRRHQHVLEPAHLLVTDLLADIEPVAALEADARRARFRVQPGEIGVAVQADRQVLTAVIVNLLQNAFKFTRPRTTVLLSATADAKHVQIEVADQCGGLAEGRVDELFRPFEQRNGDRSGLGLGLSFSRWGAEVHGGRVFARNVPGHGCVFTVELPRA
jgi:signal transduction histidine kinase